jgi:hypothetical protein
VQQTRTSGFFFGWIAVVQTEREQKCWRSSWKDQFVILVSLKASDRSDGQHAIPIFDGGLFDANYKHVLKKTQASLEWCCGGDGVACTGVHCSFIVLPLGYHELPVHSRHALQARNKCNYLVQGWVCSLNCLGLPLLQFTDGEKRKSTLAEYAEISS